jgi:hypothetical protein
MNREIRFVIKNSRGKILSQHTTYELAEKKHQRDLSWNKTHTACSADHYNDVIVQIA